VDWTGSAGPGGARLAWMGPAGQGVAGHG